MKRKEKERRTGGRAGVLLLLAMLGIPLLAPQSAHGFQSVVYFSTEESFVATAGPHAGQLISHGDLLSTTGVVVATNAQLMGNFGPMPPPPDFGLDGVYVRASGEILFSIEDTFWDEGLGTNVQHGDLLSDTGTIVQTNQQLWGNFGPMPSPNPPDYGLDAIHEVSDTEVQFSLEGGFFDEVLGTNVRHGDLLSDAGVIVKTNAQLLANFGPMPVAGDYGLDGVHKVGSGEILFSIEDTFWDENLATNVGHGDLLSDTGSVILTNAQLLAAFFGGAANVPEDYGLDAIWVVPEPATISLLGVGGLILLLKRRRG